MFGVWGSQGRSGTMRYYSTCNGPTCCPLSPTYSCPLSPTYSCPLSPTYRCPLSPTYSCHLSPSRSTCKSRAYRLSPFTCLQHVQYSPAAPFHLPEAVPFHLPTAVPFHLTGARVKLLPTCCPLSPSYLLSPFTYRQHV